MSNPIIDEEGNKYWYNNQKRPHREDGPAYIGVDDFQEWYKNGRRHRTDGPAVIFPKGLQYWWVNNKRYLNNKLFQEAAGISDEDMLAIVLKYGNI